MVDADSNVHRDSVIGRRTIIVEESRWHDPVNADLDAFMAVTTEDIRRVARKYITSGNRTTLVVRPAESST